MPIFKIFFCFFLVISISLPLYAEEVSEKQNEDQQQSNTEQKPAVEKQYYIVEVVLFKNINEQGKNDEFWNKPDILNDDSISELVNETPENNQASNDIPALAEYDMQNRQFLPLRNGIAALSAENYKLSDSAAHLRYSPNYKLLAHFGWTQRSLSKKRALPIQITSNQFSDDLIPHGSLKLYVSRYLHMLVDLKASECIYPEKTSLTEQSDMDMDKALDEQLENGTSKLTEEKVVEDITKNIALDTNQCVNQVYQFKQNRKMRSRELHYIDNPVFGLLIYVTPFSTSASDSE